jgi:hypothetical protein
MDAGDGKRLQGAGFDMRMRRRQRCEGDLRGAAEDRLNRVAAAPIKRPVPLGTSRRERRADISSDMVLLPGCVAPLMPGLLS